MNETKANGLLCLSYLVFQRLHATCKRARLVQYDVSSGAEHACSDLMRVRHSTVIDKVQRDVDLYVNQLQL